MGIKGTKPRQAVASLLFIGAVTATVVGCGGGGGSPTASPPAPAPGPGPTPPPPVPPPSLPPPPVVVTPVDLVFTGNPPTAPNRVESLPSRQLQVASLVTDPVRNQAIAARITGPTQTTIMALDPANLATVWFVDVDAYVSRLEVSPDGSMLYGLLPDSASIWQFDLLQRREVRRFVVADSSANHGPLDIAVRPGAPETIVVSIGSYQAVSPFLRLTAYDAGVARPQSLLWTGGGTTFLRERAPEVEFVDANTLLSIDNETTECGIQRLNLLSNGLSYRDSKIRGTDCFGVRLTRTALGRLFTTEGAEIDPSALVVKSVFYGVVHGEGSAVFHPGLASVLRVNPITQLETDGARPRLRLSLEEYPEDRRYLKRVVETDVASPPGPSTSSPLSVVLNATAVGTSHVVFTVLEANAGAVTVMSKDMSAVAALPPLSFASRVASGGQFSVRALNLPTVIGLSAYDVVGDRFVFVVPASAGPSGSSLAVVNPATAAVDRTIPLPGEPLHLAVAPTARIAYVKLRTMPDTLKVDLATGDLLARTTTVPVRAIAVHGSDPDVIAIIIASADPTSPLPAFATLRNLVPEGPLTDSTVRRELSFMGALYGHGSNGLIMLDTLTMTPSMGVFLFAAGGGLSQSRLGLSELDVAGRSAKYGFGRVSSISNVVDVETGVMVGRLPTGLDDFALDSASSGISKQRDEEIGKESITLTWLTQIGQTATWSPSAVLRLRDPVVELSEGRTMSLWSTDAGRNGRFAVVRFPTDDPWGVGQQVYFVTRTP